MEVHDEQGSCVARLSKSGRDKWREKLAAVERVIVLAMVERRVEDSGEEYRERCRTEQWELPVAEVCYLEGWGNS